MNSDHNHEFYRGFLSGSITVIITYPLFKINVRQQINNYSFFKSFVSVKKDGIKILYSGVLAPLIQKTLSSSLMFGFYDWYYSILSRVGNKFQIYTANNFLLVKVLSGIFSGISESILTPLERVQTLLINKNIPSYSQHIDLHNTFQISTNLVKKYGFKELYRGWTMVLLRNSISTALYFPLLEFNRNLIYLSTSKYNDNFLNNFLSGAIIGCCLSTFVFPINVARVSVQTQIDGKFQNFYTVLMKIYNIRDRNIKNLYNGAFINCLRSFISWGILNVCYEYSKKIM